MLLRNKDSFSQIVGKIAPLPCTALKIGKTLHVYDIKIHDESGNLVCVSRLTVAILSY